MNENPSADNKKIERDIEGGYVEEVGHDEQVPVETTIVPSLDPVLAQQILSFLKGLVCPGLLPAIQATQAPDVPFTNSSAPNVIGTGGNDVFFHPLMGSFMTGNEQDMLTKFLKVKPTVFFWF